MTDIENAVRAAVASARASAVEIIDICVEFKHPERAAAFIAAGTPSAAVRTSFAAKPVAKPATAVAASTGFDQAASAARFEEQTRRRPSA